MLNFVNKCLSICLKKEISCCIAKCYIYYRPQRSCVCQEFCPGGGCLPQCMLGYNPPGRHPHPGQTPTHPWADTHPPLGRHPPTPGQTPTHPWADTPPGRQPPRRLLLRTVRILMECILVEKNSTCDENIDILRIQIIVVHYPEGSFLSFSKMIK